MARGRNKKPSVKKARLRFFVFFNRKKTAQVAWFNSHKKGKEPHPGLRNCIIFEAGSRPRVYQQDREREKGGGGAAGGPLPR